MSPLWLLLIVPGTALLTMLAIWVFVVTTWDHR